MSFYPIPGGINLYHLLTSKASKRYSLPTIKKNSSSSAQTSLFVFERNKNQWKGTNYYFQKCPPIEVSLIG